MRLVQRLMRQGQSSHHRQTRTSKDFAEEPKPGSAIESWRGAIYTIFYTAAKARGGLFPKLVGQGGEGRAQAV